MHHLLDSRRGFTPVNDIGGTCEWTETEWRVLDEDTGLWVRPKGPRSEEAVRRFCRGAGPERYTPYGIEIIRRATRLPISD